MTTDKTRQLAEAFVHVATANHYMVGVIESFTSEELEDAEQLIIDRQNRGLQSGLEFDTLNLALDIVEDDKRRIRYHK